MLMCVGLQPAVPSTQITPPSSRNGSFDNCNKMDGLYHCTNSHPLFNCSTDTNQYYVWNTLTSITSANFTTPLQRVKLLLTYFIPDTSVAVRLAVSQVNGAVVAPEVAVYTLTTNEGQYSFTLPTPSLISAVNRIVITLLNGTLGINKIVFCSEPEG